jgi:hypothetical protein
MQPHLRIKRKREEGNFLESFNGNIPIEDKSDQLGAIEGLSAVTDRRIYPDKMNVAACIRELEEHFSSQGYETQLLGTAPNVLV